MERKETTIALGLVVDEETIDTGPIQLPPLLAGTIARTQFDTPTRDLRAADLGLFVARRDGTWEQEFVDGTEVSVARIFSSRPDIAAFRAPGLSQRIARAVGGKLLEPVADLQTMASGSDETDAVRVWRVRHRVRKGGRETVEHQLRFRGPAMPAIAIARKAVGGAPFRLAIPVLSADPEATVLDAGSGHIRRARPSTVLPDDNAFAAMDKAFLASAEMIAANLAAVQHVDDPEAVKQLRVALRRFRSSLKLFCPLIRLSDFRRLNRRARDIARIAGRLRDADVLAALRREPAPDAVRDAVRVELKNADAGGLVFDILAATGACRKRSARNRSAARFGSTALEPLWEAVADYGPRIDLLGIDTCHEARKDLKILRYSLDILSPCYRPSLVAMLTRSIKRVQKQLGLICDEALLAELGIEPDEDEAIDVPAARLAAQREWQVLLERPRPWREKRRRPADAALPDQVVQSFA